MSVLRSDSSERSRNKRSEAKDSRSDGCHAQHLLHNRHQQHDPSGPPLLFQVHGHQPLWLGPQCLSLPATKKVTALFYRFSFFFFLVPRPDLPTQHLSICSACLQLRMFFLGLFFPPPCQVRRMLYCV